MNYTDILKLPCPEDNDMGAMTVYMQCLANLLEGEFTSRYQQLDEFRRRYVGIWSNPALITGITDGTLIETGLSNVFWNAPGLPNSGIAGSVVDPYRYNLPGHIAGALYEVGMYVSLAASGTVTTGSRRLVVARTYTPGSGTDEIGTSSDVDLDITEETNTGGEFLQSSIQIIEGQSPYNAKTFVPVIRHNNASTLNIAALGMLVWVALIGTGDQVEVS